MTQPDFTGRYAAYDLLLRWQCSAPATFFQYTFALGPRTVHVADGPYAGTYSGRVVAAATLREEFGGDALPRFVWPEFTCEIVRTDLDDEAIDDIVTKVNRAGANEQTLEVFLTAGGRCAESDRVFIGAIADDGVEITAATIRLRARHLLAKYDIRIPAQRFLIGTRLGDAAKNGEPLPILYGAWRDKAARYALPAFITERRTEIVDGSHYVGARLCAPNANGLYDYSGRARWRFAGGTPHGFDIWAGQYARRTGVDDLSAGTFALADSRAVDAGSGRNVWRRGDTVHLEYAWGNRDGDNLLIQDPVDVVYDLLRHYAGVPASKIGATITPGSGAQLSTSYLVRAHLSEARPTITGWISDLCRDTGLLLFIYNNKFELAHHPLWQWEYGAEGDAVALDPRTVLDSQRHVFNPRSWNINQIVLRYRRAPDTGRYTEEIETGDDDAGVLEIDSDWLWRPRDAQATLGYLAATVAVDNRQLELTSPLAGLQLAVAERPAGATGAARIPRVCWRGDDLEDAYFYPYRVEVDFAAARARVWAHGQALRFYRAVVAPDDAPSFAEASEAQKRAYGYATDEDGTIAGGGTYYSNAVNRAD
ncbi:MAG TPA: hypothetical protein PKW95_14545 [bacterium]|nr:hypothetical protein [bacterium]